MKTFYFAETEKKAKFGKDVEQCIYAIENRIPKLLCTHNYNSEAFKGLVIAGLLPIKYLHSYCHDIPHKMYKL